MKRTLLFAGVMLALGAGCANLDHVRGMREPTIAEKDALLTLERRVFQAIQEKDRSGLTGLIADDFELHSLGAKVMHKSEFIDALVSTPGTVTSLELESVDVRIVGEVGVIIGQQRAVVRMPDGKPQTDVEAFTDVARKQGARWRLVLSQSTPVKK